MESEREMFGADLAIDCDEARNPSMLAYTPLVLRSVLALSLVPAAPSTSAPTEARPELIDSSARSQRRFVAFEVVVADDIDSDIATQVRERVREQLAGAELFIDDASSVGLRIDLHTSSASATDFPYAIVLDGEAPHRGEYTCKDCSIPTLLADIEAHVAEALPKLRRAAEDELDRTSELVPAPTVAVTKVPKKTHAQARAENMAAAGIVVTTIGGAAALGGALTNILLAVEAKKPGTTMPKSNYIGGGVAIGAGVALVFVGVGLLVAGRRRGVQLTHAPTATFGRGLVGLGYGGRF